MGSAGAIANNAFPVAQAKWVSAKVSLVILGGHQGNLSDAG